MRHIVNKNIIIIIMRNMNKRSETSHVHPRVRISTYVYILTISKHVLFLIFEPLAEIFIERAEKHYRNTRARGA